MSAEELLEQRRLAESLAAIEKLVRQEPQRAPHRIFAFQLLALQGQWERALNQLAVASQLDEEYMLTATVYGAVLQCEMFRASVFAGKESPLIFGDPPDWVGWMVEATHLLAQEKASAARELRQRALRSAVPQPGTINSQPFRFMMDADARLGPLLEIILEGRYFWVPMERVSRIEMEVPDSVEDLMWTPATFTWSNGGQSPAFIPTRYPGTEVAGDDDLRLSRKTIWQSRAERYNVGLGQREFLTDTGRHALLDTRSITLQPLEDKQVEAGAQGAEFPRVAEVPP